jgi:hypothetical protein
MSCPPKPATNVIIENLNQTGILYNVTTIP